METAWTVATVDGHREMREGPCSLLPCSISDIRQPLSLPMMFSDGVYTERPLFFNHSDCQCLMRLFVPPNPLHTLQAIPMALSSMLDFIEKACRI